jgi:putative ATP-dependent endonuclease of OLD family
MHLSRITIENFRCFGEGDKRFEMDLRPGLTALVGENEAGKTAVVDAIRFVLGTTDQEWYRLEDTDFHTAREKRAGEIRIVCVFEGLSDPDCRAFIECLTYAEDAGNPPLLFIHWTAKDTGETRRGRPYRRWEMRSGKAGDGPCPAQDARELLRTTYLRPLRDAEQALSAGRASRLSQILYSDTRIKSDGGGFDEDVLSKEERRKEVNYEFLDALSVLGIGDLANALLKRQSHIAAARDSIDGHLKELSLRAENVASRVEVGGASASEGVRLRQLLEKLDVNLAGEGRLGLGSMNLLFMACELLLLAQEDVGNRLLLIEEPEAHLHPQRQLRVMKYLQEQADKKGLQVIVTTHSPSLASAIDLENLVMISDRRAFSMVKGQTELEPTDYGFLQRFLDVTKANLFFARGVVIVEGPAEEILLPTLASIMRHDFAEHGVSIVNVGGIGLRRYARIFLRKDAKEHGTLMVPVACVTDMDVMPDCAPTMIGRLVANEEWPDTAKRRWRAKRDFVDGNALTEHRNEKTAKASGQNVRTFVSDEWTLEYDLALGPQDDQGKLSRGLRKHVFVAASLAEEDNAINEGRKDRKKVEVSALKTFADMHRKAGPTEGCTVEEVLASKVYTKFAKDGVSKAIAAQYLAERLRAKHEAGVLSAADLRARLPRYLVEAIEYVTRGPVPEPSAAEPDDEVEGHERP